MACIKISVTTVTGQTHEQIVDSLDKDGNTVEDPRELEKRAIELKNEFESIILEGSGYVTLCEIEESKKATIININNTVSIDVEVTDTDV